MNIKIAFLISIIFHTAVILGIPSSLIWRSSPSEIVRNSEPITVQIVYRRADTIMNSEEEKSHPKRKIPVSRNFLQPEKTNKIIKPKEENTAPDVLTAREVVEDKKRDIEPTVKLDETLHYDSKNYFAATGDISLPTGNAGYSDPFAANHEKAIPIKSESKTNDGAGECDRALTALFEHNFDKEIVVQELRSDRNIEKRQGGISLRIAHGSAEIRVVEASGNALMDEMALSAASKVARQVVSISQCNQVERTVKISYFFRWKERHE